MAKQLYEIKDFSGGLNAYADPRDIDDSEFAQNWNVIVDRNGILRIVGSAVESIDATLVNNTHFQKGYGLFQFNTDYSLGSPNFEGSFEDGYENGKVDSVTSNTVFTLQDKSTVSSSNDFYNGMFIYFYSATNNNGETRVISDYVGSSRTITLETATSGTITTSDRYMIFRWESDNFEMTDSEKDFIIQSSTAAGDAFQGRYGDNFLATKTTTTDEKSITHGNITFTPNGNDSSADYLTLTPGINYSLSFDCAASDRWYNMVSNGVITGIEDTSINVDEGSGITAGSTSAINIDGTLGASSFVFNLKILNKDVYKSDGTFIGRCTAVTYTSSSDGTITFGNGTHVALADNDDLYVSGFGDKPPWIELYSTTVEKKNGALKTITDDTPTPSANWTSTGSNSFHSELIQSETSSNTYGGGAMFSARVNSDGSEVKLSILEAGSGYRVGDTFRVYDPGDAAKYVTVEVASVNIKGLTLMDGNWVSQNDNETALGASAKYLINKDVNYVYNGDFANSDIDNGWTTQGNGFVLKQFTWTSGNDGSGDGQAQYGGHDGTLHMCMQSEAHGDANTFEWDEDLNEPNTYIYQTLTLDGGMWYHLNFIHSFEYNYEIPGNVIEEYTNGVSYALYDAFEEEYITGWTNVDWFSKPGVSWNNITYNQFQTAGIFSWINQDTDWSFYKDFPNGPFQRLNQNEHNKSIYHKFYVPKSKNNWGSGNGQTQNIQLRISIAKPSSPYSTSDALGNAVNGVTIGGITVHKAYNDLTTMSYYDSEAANPFTDNIKNWSNYKLNFRIPEDFNEVSDWKLKIHGGKYGWRDSNEFDANIDYAATASQEVYFDNIVLRSPSSDLNALDTKGETTLLTSNQGAHSVIKMWNGNTWNTLTEWNDKNSMPVYNYINGILKISDANFDNNNNNKFIYYHNNNSSAGEWKIKEEALITPPTVSLEHKASTFTSGGLNYNACSYLNKFYQELNWCEQPSTRHNGDIKAWTNWNLSEFADPNHNSTGIGHIIRYSAGEKSESHHWSNPQTASWASDGAIAIADPDDENKHITSMGEGLWAFSSGNYPGAKCMLNPVNSDRHWAGRTVYCTRPILKCAIHATQNSGFANGLGILQFLNESVEDDNELLNNASVKSINFKIRWESSLSYKNHAFNQYDGHCSAGTHWTQSSCQNSHEGFWVSQLLTRYIENQIPPFFKVKAGVLGSDNYINNPLDFVQNLGTNHFLTKVKEMDFGTGDNGGSPSEGITPNRIYGANNPVEITKVHHATGSNHQVIVECLFEGSISWNPGEIPLNNIQAEDLYFHIMEENAEENAEHSDESWASNYDAGMWDYYGDYESSINPGDTDDLGTTGVGNTSWNSGSTNWGIRTVRKHGHARYPTWSRFFVDKLDIDFYRSDVDISSLNKDATVNFDWQTPEQFLENNQFLDPLSSAFVVSGWGGRRFQLASTTVNKFDEESNLSNPTFFNSTDIMPTEDQSPSVSVLLDKSYYSNDFIKKTKFYLKDGESEIWYLQFWIDHEDNKMYSSTSAISSPRIDETGDKWGWFLDSSNFKNYNEVNSYESETLVRQEDAVNNNLLSSRYKTSVVCNNRMYVGNIFQNGEKHGDRMSKSPIGKYNIFPKSNFIDVAINDGDDITALSYYKDKILQFKRKKVFVINTSGDYEFLEDTFNDIGVDGQYSVATTKSGIVWANENGCFLYDGESLENLTENKIPTSEAYSNPSTTLSKVNRWCANSSDGDCVVGYIRHKDSLLINFTRTHSNSGAIPTGAVYHFTTKSWSLIYGVWNSSSSSMKTGNMSNMITNSDGDVLFYHITTDNSTAERMNTIRKWVHESDSNLSTKNAYFVTKDISFGNINVKKKLYRVYITYRVLRDGTDSGMIVKGAVNGTGNFNVDFSQTSKFINTQTNCYSGGHLDETDGDWKTAELKFDTPSDVSKITSFQLQIYSGSAVYDFEINDISISYRTKNVK